MKSAARIATYSILGCMVTPFVACSSSSTDAEIGTMGGTAAIGRGGQGGVATGGIGRQGGATAIGTSSKGGTTATGGASLGGATGKGGTTVTGGASLGGATGSGGVLQSGGAGGTGGTGGASSSTATTGGTGGTPGTTVVPPPSELIGWAKTDKCGPKGTTGGGDGPATVVVTSTSELVAALSAAGPRVIEVRGQMKGARIKDTVGVKDKTVIGTNSAFISDGMRIDGGRNIIIKNIRFGESKVVDGDDNLADGLTIHNTTCVWIDHCEFMNSIDGNLDIVGGDGFMSSWVTVSWSKFWYEPDYAANVNRIHRFSNLIVGSDDKPDPLPYVTYHHNWWAENVTERMPRGRWAWAHVFNNYYSTQGNNYGIGVSVGIQFVVENNFFEPGFEDPVYFFNKDQGAAVRLSGNQMDGVRWVDTKAENATLGTAFNPADYYSYTLQSPADAKASIIAGAGRK